MSDFIGPRVEISLVIGQTTAGTSIEAQGVVADGQAMREMPPHEVMSNLLRAVGIYIQGTAPQEPVSPVLLATPQMVRMN